MVHTIAANYNNIIVLFIRSMNFGKGKKAVDIVEAGEPM